MNRILAFFLFSLSWIAGARAQTQPDILTTNSTGQINRSVKVPSGKTLSVESGGTLSIASGGVLARGTAVILKDDGTTVAYQASADTDSARGAALIAAKTAAASGETIMVGPGGYAITASLAKDEVNWWLAEKATITLTDNDTGVGIWDDGGSAMQFEVGGHGNFYRTADELTTEANIVKVNHANSDIKIECNDIFAYSDSSGYTPTYAVWGQAGKVWVHCRQIITDGSSEGSTCAWWANGEMHVVADRLYSTQIAVTSACNASPTGEAYIEANEICGGDAFGAVGNFGTNSSAAIWVVAKTLRSGPGPSGNPAGVSITYPVTSQGPSIYQTTTAANRMYVTGQKLFGAITLLGNGLTYIRADKISANKNGTSVLPNLFYAPTGTGTSRIEIGHWDVGSFTGETIKMAAGTHLLRGGDLVCGSAKGVELGGGTLRLERMRLDTSGSSSQNPITKSGGTLVLQNAILVAEATRDSIEAGTAQNVVAYSSYANTAADGNVTVTITGGLTVDVDVQ